MVKKHVGHRLRSHEGQRGVARARPIAWFVAFISGCAVSPTETVAHLNAESSTAADRLAGLLASDWPSEAELDAYLSWANEQAGPDGAPAGCAYYGTDASGGRWQSTPIASAYSGTGVTLTRNQLLEMAQGMRNQPVTIACFAEVATIARDGARQPHPASPLAVDESTSSTRAAELDAVADSPRQDAELAQLQTILGDEPLPVCEEGMTVGSKQMGWATYIGCMKETQKPTLCGPTVIVHNKSGKVQEKGSMRCAGSRWWQEGPWETYYVTGELRSKGEYTQKDGSTVLHGTWTEWDSNGENESTVTFELGVAKSCSGPLAPTITSECTAKGKLSRKKPGRSSCMSCRQSTMDNCCLRETGDANCETVASAKASAIGTCGKEADRACQAHCG